MGVPVTAVGTTGLGASVAPSEASGETDGIEGGIGSRDSDSY